MGVFLLCVGLAGGRLVDREDVEEVVNLVGLLENAVEAVGVDFNHRQGGVGNRADAELIIEAARARAR